MKKLVNVALAALLLLSLLSVTVGAAQEPASALATRETAFRGETVAVSVTLEAPAVSTVGLMLEWDENVLEWEGGSWESLSGISMPNVQLGSKIASCAFSPVSDVSGKILTLNFKVKDEAVYAKTTVKAKLLVKTGGVNTQKDLSVSFDIVCNHVFDKKVETDAYKKNDASCTEKLTYFKSCACGEKGTETFTVGDLLPHVFDKKVETDTYKKNDASCTEKLTYFTSCACGEKGTETFTVGDLLPHSYSSKWSKNQTQHWHECACGEKKDLATHTAGPAATETSDQICTVCEAILTPALSHTHSYSNSYSQNQTQHWHECACGAKKDLGSHVFDNDCDTTCNTCSYTRSITHRYKTDWTSDQSGHWHECTVCGIKADNAAHTPGPAATEASDQVCTVCAFVLQEKLPHSHKFQSAWSKDEANHWHECACGEKEGLAAHDWDEGSVTLAPTEEKEGEKTFTCQSCGETKTEAIEKSAPPANGAEDDDGLPIVAIIALVLIVLAAGVTVFLFLQKKNSASN